MLEAKLPDSSLLWPPCWITSKSCFLYNVLIRDQANLTLLSCMFSQGTPLLLSIVPGGPK